MATHLAARLVWHDRGWDGRICNAPKDNGWCIRYEWVREERDDQAEAQRCGKPVTQDVLPPCPFSPGWEGIGSASAVMHS
jgi:exodeoxyribonuclease V alpha subunit